MAKKDELVILRQWNCGDEGPDISEVCEAFREVAQALRLEDFYVTDAEGGGFHMVCSDTRYMQMEVTTMQEGRDTFVVMGARGKGYQIKASEMESMLVKAAGVMSGVAAGYRKGKNISRRFGIGSAAGSVTAGVSSAVGATIGLSVRIAAKGVKMLFRDKEAYDREMGFYTRALSIGDFAVGATDSEDCLSILKANAGKGDPTAQYVLGNAYLEGRCVEKSERTGFEWLGKAAAGGYRKSREMMAWVYTDPELSFDAEQRELGVIYMEELADGGNTDAMEILVFIYTSPQVPGIEPDERKVMEYAERYEDEGLPYITFILAQAADPSVAALADRKDEGRALQLYESLIEDGENDYVKEACLGAAAICERSGGSEQKAAAYYGKAYREGAEEAGEKLIDFYLRGMDVPEDTVVSIASGGYGGDSTLDARKRYCLYRIKDRRQEYRAAMDNAEKYLSFETEDEGRRAEAGKYLADMNEKISRMTEEERMDFFHEKKPAFYGLKKAVGNMDLAQKKKIGIAAAVIIAVIIAVIVIANVMSDRGNEVSPETSGGPVEETTSGESTGSGAASWDVFEEHDLLDQDMDTVMGKYDDLAGLDVYGDSDAWQMSSAMAERSEEIYEDSASGLSFGFSGGRCNTIGGTAETLLGITEDTDIGSVINNLQIASYTLLTSYDMLMQQWLCDTGRTTDGSDATYMVDLYPDEIQQIYYLDEDMDSDVYVTTENIHDTCGGVEDGYDRISPDTKVVIYTIIPGEDEYLNW